MKTLKINTTEFIRGFKIKNINEEDSIVNQILYITFELYKQVCKRVWKINGWEYYTETRAYFIGRTLKRIIRDDLKIKIEQIKDLSPIIHEATINKDKKISCKIELGSHEHFIEEAEAINYEYLENLQINLGFCTRWCTFSNKPWLRKPKKVHLRLWIGIKTTNPIDQSPVTSENMFETTIHEFIHVLDNIEKFFGKQISLESTKPILEKVLNEFFIFEK